MSTALENSEANLYAYEYQGQMSERITYRKNLVNLIKARCGDALEEFDANTMSSEDFGRFLERARTEGFTVYRLNRL